MDKSKADTFAVGAAYVPYVGRWSSLVAREFVGWLGVSKGARWLDVGCGTGALTEAILQMAGPAEVVGVDPSEGFLTYAREHVRDDRAAFRQGNAMALPLDDATFNAVVAGLVLNFVPKADVALAEMARVTKAGATVAAYVWDYASGMEMLRIFWDAAVELDPSVADRDQGNRFPICNPGPLAELFEGGGLTGVEVRAIDIPTHFRDFEDYWQPFLGGQGSAPTYVTTLTEEQKAALREQVRTKLPIAEDGSISMTARAWAVRGRMPPIAPEGRHTLA